MVTTARKTERREWAPWRKALLRKECEAALEHGRRITNWPKIAEVVGYSIKSCQSMYNVMNGTEKPVSPHSICNYKPIILSREEIHSVMRGVDYEREFHARPE